MIMVNTCTTIKCNICLTQLHTFRSKYDFIPKSWSHVACTLCQWLPEKMDPQPGQIWLHFHWVQTLGDHSPYNPNLILSPVIFGLKERLAGWKFTRVQDLSKAIPHFRVQRYTCFCVPICSSDVAEVARNLCGQWKDVLWRLAEVWWRYVHWFPFYITCDRTFGLALISNVTMHEKTRNIARFFFF